MKNEKVRKIAKENGVTLWEIALQMGISQSTMTRMLRLPLTPEKEAEILSVIERIAKGGE